MVRRQAPHSIVGDDIGVRARTTGRANEETTNAIVTKIARSIPELDDPVFWVYLGKIKGNPTSALRI